MRQVGSDYPQARAGECVPALYFRIGLPAQSKPYPYLRIIERRVASPYASPKSEKLSGTDREAGMANVQFFHFVLIGLVAMTLVSGAMTGVMAMRTHAGGWDAPVVISGEAR